MNQLEQELKNALHRAADSGVSGPVRLRNPALIEAGRLARSTGARQRSRWWPAALSAALSVTVIAAVLTIAATSRGHVVGGPDGSPTTSATDSGSASSTPASPTLEGTPGSDGVHPLWNLAVPAAPARPISGLPAGTAPEVPQPYTLNPDLAPDLARYPTLVTANGSVQF